MGAGSLQRGSCSQPEYSHAVAGANSHLGTAGIALAMTARKTGIVSQGKPDRQARHI